MKSLKPAVFYCNNHEMYFDEPEDFFNVELSDDSMMMVNSLNSAAYHLDTLVVNAFDKYKNTTTPILSTAITEFKQTLQGNQFSLTDVINFVSYNRCFGNFSSIIVMLVFEPSILMDDEEYNFISKMQVQDALHTTFDLVINHNLETDIIDFHSTKPMQYVFRMLNRAPNIPDHILEYVPFFKYVFKHGYNIINIQQNHVKNWLKRHYDRQKHAVATIGNWWFETLYCPYTTVGRKRINNMALNWYKKAII